MIAATDERESKITQSHNDSQNTQTLQNVQYLQKTFRKVLKLCALLCSRSNSSVHDPTLQEHPCT